MTTEVADWLGGRAVALSGLTPGPGTADLRPFTDALAGVRVVGLGEATHGSREFVLLRHRMLEAAHPGPRGTWPTLKSSPVDR